MGIRIHQDYQVFLLLFLPLFVSSFFVYGLIDLDDVGPKLGVDNQLSLVLYPIIYQVFPQRNIPGGDRISSINSE